MQVYNTSLQNISLLISFFRNVYLNQTITMSKNTIQIHNANLLCKTQNENYSNTIQF